MQPLDCLRRYPLFNLLKPSQMDAWLKAGQEWSIGLGETIFQEGATGIWAYLILEGSARALRRTAGGREITLGKMGPGEVFGEYALIPPHANTASCRAVEATRLLTLHLLPMRSLFAKLAPNLKDWLRLHSLVRYLRDQPFLGFMSAPSALAFLEHLTPTRYPAGTTIQADGLGGDQWHYLQSGQVALRQADGKANAAEIVLGPGDCFGE